MNTLQEIILIASIPSAVTAFCFWMIEHWIQKQNKKREEKEEKMRQEAGRRERIREQSELLLVQSVGASLALGEATAKAVERIPDAHCNGDMRAALEYAGKVKHEQRDFLTKQGIENIYD